ncbi:MAG: tetratricopeptide repeat protein [Sphingobacteriales bacterium]|nr:tetratricopeptide repeat protein [Sphingobacteriales bacterium]MBI3719214.1 tetratricopeptide repeat protein [Sphingobacteriales bacterium]
MIKRHKAILSVILASATIVANSLWAQEKLSPLNNLSFPPAYLQLQSDTARMRFLVKTINDSLDEGQLTHVYDWARVGLSMAEKAKTDSMIGIFNFFIGKAYTYHLLKPDSAIVYYKKVLPYFPDKLRKYSVYSVREIMERYSEMGNKDSSFVYLDSLKVLIDTMPETSPKRIGLSTNIATVYQWFGMFKTAVNYYQTAINGNRKNGNNRGLGLALANLGELYSESNDDNKALQYSKEALGYLADVNMPYMLTAANIATYYSNGEQFDSAIVYYKLSAVVANKVNNTGQLNVLQFILGDIYLGQKKYEQAKEQLEKSEVALRESGDRWGLVRNYLSLARLDTSLHKFNDAKEYLLKALKIAKEDKQETLVAVALQSLAAVCAKLNDYKTAFNYQNQYVLQKDSMTNEKTKAELADLEISYQTLQKEQQISLLQKENDIKTLQLQNSRRSILFYLAGFLMLLTVAGIIFYQRNQRNKIQAQKIKAELQTQVLRSQMNPHFIFNSLNSIENFIMQNEKRNASDYLNKFSRLIRSILDSSRNEVVPLAKDMEILNLYVELEQLRFNNKFTYKTHVDPQLLQGDYRVPSLLIQPYLENAIVHGIAHSNKEDLQLTVTAVLEGDDIKYSVQDNGVGRQLAAAYNLQNKPHHKSVGLKITEERIANFNKTENTDNYVQFTDITDEENQPAGTRVDITLKAA